MVIPFENLACLFTSDEHSRGIIRLNIAEAALLYKYVKRVRKGNILEIGRKHGGSTALIGSALDSGVVYSIDIVRHPEVDHNIRFVRSKIILIDEDSKKLEWDKEVDLLFVDGDHSFKGVKADIENFFPFVKIFCLGNQRIQIFFAAIFIFYT